MNENPYLLWADAVGPGLRFLRMLANAQAQRRSGQAARIKATYDNVAPYNEAELRRSNWLDGTPRVTNPSLNSAMIAEQANRPFVDYYAALNLNLERVKELFGDAVTFDYHADEILVTINRSKL